MKRSLCLGIFLIVLLAELESQSMTATVSNNKILIGDQITLTLEIESGSAQPLGIIMAGMEADEAIEIVRPGELTKNDTSGLYEQVMLITSFDSGTHYVPEIGVVLDRNGTRDTIYSRRIPITVNTIPPDSVGLAPVKPIIEEEMKWTDYLIYMIPALIILFFLLILWYWKNRKVTLRSEEIEVPLPPADIEAMEALKTLKEGRLWEKGEIKVYESRISLILRRYIERQFAFPAMEWTTGEITRHLGQLQKFPGIPVALANDILSISDLVKYAKSDPGADVHAGQISKTEEFIRVTKDLLQEEE